MRYDTHIGHMIHIKCHFCNSVLHVGYIVTYLYVSFQNLEMNNGLKFVFDCISALDRNH